MATSMYDENLTRTRNVRTAKGDAARLRRGRQEAPSRVPDRGAGGSRLRHQRMRQRRRAADGARPADLPDLILLGMPSTASSPANFWRRWCARPSSARFSPSARASRSSSRRCSRSARNTASRCCRRSPRRLPRRRCASASRCCCPRSRHRARQCMSARPCTPAGSNSGTSRRSTPARWSAAAPRRWCGCGIRPGAWCRRPISSRKSDDPHFRACRSS